MTDEPTIDRRQAWAIAQLLRVLRPGWDELATIDYVGRASAKRPTHDLADLVHGCIRTAQDQQASTPAALLHEHPSRWERSVRHVETATERQARIQAQLDARAAAQQEREYRGSDATRGRLAKTQIRATLAAAEQRRQQTPEETR